MIEPYIQGTVANHDCQIIKFHSRGSCYVLQCSNNFTEETLVNILKLSWWQNLKEMLLLENHRLPNYINFNELDIQEYENLRNWHSAYSQEDFRIKNTKKGTVILFLAWTAGKLLEWSFQVNIHLELSWVIIVTLNAERKTSHASHSSPIYHKTSYCLIFSLLQ